MSKKTQQASLIEAPAVINLRHVKSIISAPWRGRYAAITRPGDSLLLHISKSCVWSVKQLSRRTNLALQINGEAA